MKKPTKKKPRSAQFHVAREAQARVDATMLRRALRREADVRRLAKQHARAIGASKQHLIAFILEIVASVLSRDKADEVQRVLES